VSQRPAGPEPVSIGDPVGELFEPSTGAATAGQVLAAGAICWRYGPDGELELLLVHSARWGDWSWPKGKLDPGETLPQCAVREVTEETGVRPELGVMLPPVSYVLPDGRDKTVRYWAARVRGAGPRTALDDEIAEVAWLPAPAAIERLDRPGDLVPLEELLELDGRGRLDTRPLLVLRHAKARSRARWSGTEADRPLTATGLRQARSLAGLLSCWEPERLLCSPWKRCMETLGPYLDRRGPVGAALEAAPLLSEQGLHNDPDRIGENVAELLNERRSGLLCTHRPVLAAVVQALARVGDGSVRAQLPDDDPWLSPGEILIAHVSDHKHRHKVTRRIHSVERYRGESVRNVQLQ
jgi:8-oxo-dGTP pyrophosphatase MutT (NUDIX family)/phosphohistidine phosphatase SixA